MKKILFFTVLLLPQYYMHKLTCPHGKAWIQDLFPNGGGMRSLASLSIGAYILYRAFAQKETMRSGINMLYKTEIAQQ